MRLSHKVIPARSGRSHSGFTGIYAGTFVIGVTALAQLLHDEGLPIAGQLLACPMLDDRTAYQAIAPRATISKRFNASAAAFAKEVLGG